MESDEKSLSWLDYAIFAASLSLSIGTGVYHAIRSWLLLRSGEAKSSAKDEYLMGGHSMPPIPVALSLLTTFLSGILMLAVPAEMFQRGVQIWLNFIVGALSSVITCVVFLPVFHKMKCTCLHEYFVHRYNSTLIRRLFSVIFLSFTIIYMSVVIYAPSVALSPVLRIHKWWLVLIFGLCTTLYTCIGGLKAVVWSDSLQAVLMYSGVFMLIVQGLRHPKVGGIRRVWNIAVESGRTAELFRFDPRIDQYNSVWINLISGTITWLASFGVNQLAIQRYASLPTLQQAQRIIYWTLIPFTILCSIVAFVGFIALAYFYNCNPIETGEISETDHLTILFARDILLFAPVANLRAAAVNFKILLERAMQRLYSEILGFPKFTLHMLASDEEDESVALASISRFWQKGLQVELAITATTCFDPRFLEPTPGLFGLHVSCIMSATLSTLSSGMNSMAAAVYEDFLKLPLDGRITDHQATLINKAIVVTGGIAATALAFSAEALGGILRVAVSVMGAISGPMVAIFVLAMFFPRSGFWSCLISFVVSNIIMVIICIANYIEDPYREHFLPTNSSVFGCNSQNFTVRPSPAYDAQYGDPNSMFISRISTYGYAGVGFVIMMVIGAVINFVKPEQKAERIRHLTFAGRNEPWPDSHHEYDHFINGLKR